MALNRKTFPKVTAAAADTFTPSEHFNTVLYTGTGAAQRIGGYINRGAVFNGSSSIITLPNEVENPMISSGAFGITGWFQTDTVSSRQGIISLFQDMYLIIEITSSGTLKGIVSNSSGTNTEITGTTSLSTNTWYHFAFTGDSDKIELFLDNSSEGSSTAWDGTWYAGTNITPKIGTVTTNYFNGTLDQIRIFDKELLSSERTTLYNETHASTTKSTTDIFGDGSGVALYQLDGNANDTGGVSGKFGAAAHFDNNTSRSAINVSINLGGIKSISHWVKLDEFQVDNIHMFSSSSNNLQLGILNTSGQRAFFYYDGSSTNQFGTSYPNDNNWHHLVWVLNGTSAELYLDGSSIGTATTASTTQTSIVIGTNSLSSGVRGKMDDVRIYSDVLTSTEVGYLYNNTTASIPTDNLEAHYKFDGDARDETTSPSYDGVASNVKYAYDGTASNITYQEATKFSPDLVWIKNRDSASYNHNFQDTLRGTSSYLTTASTSNAITVTNCITSFDSNGFTIGNNGAVNNNTDDYVAWCWNAGTEAAASNTDGVTAGSVTAVTSTVKANTAAGFSICTFTTPSSGKPSWGHGLDSAPELIIVKNTGGTDPWFIYAPSLLGQKELRFTTAAAASYSPDFISVDTSKIDLGSTSFNISASSAHVAYCFHSVDGYSKIGTYTGNGSTSGPMVETGFAPALVMIKGTDQTSDWIILDNKRDNINPNSARLDANSSGAEYTGEDIMDFHSNGFQLKTSSASKNGSGNEFIYLAIAADPDETTPTVENSFDVVTYTGNGSTQSIETDFKPDLVITKSRSFAEKANVFDTVRGATNRIYTAGTHAEAAQSNSLTSFDESGFSIGDWSDINTNNETYVSWCWKAAAHDDNLPEINTNGTIDSTVSVNDAAGFSIVKWTGDGNAASIGHGLSSSPDMIILKNTSDIDAWEIHHKDVTPITHSLTFTTGAARLSNYFTAKSSTTFSVGGYNRSNGNGDTMIAYCWYSVSGHSKIGSYTGNGTSGHQITSVGFEPRFVIIKKSSGTGSWYMFDSQRLTGVYSDQLTADGSAAEATGTYVDFISNGFQLDTIASDLNTNNETFIYMAFK